MTQSTLRQNLRASTSLTSSDPLKEDFRNFLWLIWQHLNLPEPTPVQYDIARWLQHGPRRLIVEAFRGVGKSWVTAAFVCWLLYCDPQLKIMVVSASKQRADDFSTFVLRLLHEVPQLLHLRPQGDQRSSKVSFDVGPAKADQSPSVKSVGITGQLTGSRADVIVADDIEVANNSATQAMRDALAERIKEFDAVLKPGGRVVYLGTPQTEQSIYNRLPERGYVIRVWPARYPTADKRDRYGARLAPIIARKLEEDESLAGKSTDPRRFSEEDLDERQLSYGRSGFALQFMLDTSISDGDRYPLKLSDLIVHPLDPLRAPTDFMWASGPQQALDLPNVGLQGDRFHRPGWVADKVAAYEGGIMFVDPSGRGKDETAYAAVKVLHGRLFLVAAGGFKGGYERPTLVSLLMTAKKHGISHIIAEPNFGGGMFVSLLKAVATELYPCRVEDADWSNTQKEKRIIDTLEPVMNQHRLVVCPSVIEQDYKSTLDYQGDDAQRCRLFYQLTRITGERGSLAHDDRLDALAGAVAHFERIMGTDTRKAALEHMEREHEAELERFMANAIGNRFKEPVEHWSSSIMRRNR